MAATPCTAGVCVWHVAAVGERSTGRAQGVWASGGTLIHISPPLPARKTKMDKLTMSLDDLVKSAAPRPARPARAAGGAGPVRREGGAARRQAAAAPIRRAAPAPRLGSKKLYIGQFTAQGES